MRKEPEFATLTARGCFLHLGWKPISRRAPDDDWITVYGRVGAPEGEWRFRDASLEIREACRLATWLANIAGGRNAPPSICFTEPCLTFEYSRTATGTVLLRTRFIGEVSPPWLWGDGEAVWEHGYWLELEVPAGELGRFGSELHRLVGRTP